MPSARDSWKKISVGYSNRPASPVLRHLEKRRRWLAFTMCIGLEPLIGILVQNAWPTFGVRERPSPFTPVPSKPPDLHCQRRVGIVKIFLACPCFEGHDDSSTGCCRRPSAHSTQARIDRENANSLIGFICPPEQLPIRFKAFFISFFPPSFSNSQLSVLDTEKEKVLCKSYNGMLLSTFVQRVADAVSLDSDNLDNFTFLKPPPQTAPVSFPCVSVFPAPATLL
ncbi:hypothetical protein VTO42DRAFT_7412 [Malbranchea cinnamomea]